MMKKIKRQGAWALVPKGSRMLTKSRGRANICLSLEEAQELLANRDLVTASNAELLEIIPVVVKYYA